MLPNETELVQIEQEIDALMAEVHAEFAKGWPLIESIDRLFTRLSPKAARLLAIRGMAATAEFHLKLTTCAECGAVLEKD